MVFSTLQEVGFLPTLGRFVVFFCPKGLFGKNFGLWECCPVLAL